jgi:hypothetical protein
MTVLNDAHNSCIATSTLVAVTSDQNSGPVYRFGSLLFALRNHGRAARQKRINVLRKVNNTLAKTIDASKFVFPLRISPFLDLGVC